MMKIFNLVKSEFKKNYNVAKFCIIIPLLLISVISSVEIYRFFNQKVNYEDVTVHHSSEYKNNYNTLKNKNERTALEEYKLLYYQDAIKYYNHLDEINANDMSYQTEMVDGLLSATHKNRIINDIKNNGKEDFLSNCEALKQEKEKIGYLEEPNLIYYYLCEIDMDSFDKIYQENLHDIELYESILKENKYYDYLEKYNIDYGLSNILIENKVTDQNDFRAINNMQYQRMKNVLEKIIISKEDYENGYESPYGKRYFAATSEFDSYDNYLKYEKIIREEAKKNQEILLYSTKNNIKHDISFYYPDDWLLIEGTYTTSKTCINNILLHSSIIILIIVSITSGGIVSKEHNSGTIKNIITTPVRRWKILLSKFIYLILHTYIIWFILLFILIIYSGIRFGFEDIFAPKLLYSGGKVIEVNYILYLIKIMLIAGIPMIAFLSILFFLSTITLNTAVTVGVSTIIAIVSPIMWILIYSTKLYSLKFTPFMYFDPGFIINKSKEYSFFIKNTSMDFTLGIIVSIICIVILYSITNIVYSKRDIKS